MPRRSASRSSQPELFPRSKRPAITLPDNHPMVVLTDTLDWTEMEARAQKIRQGKLKNAAGRPPHLRATLGALVLMALRRLPYRETEEQIRYYAPARYLCGLTETDWTPDFTTVQDFSELLGEDGVRLINESVVEHAVALGLADPKTVVAFEKNPSHLWLEFPSSTDRVTGNFLSKQPMHQSLYVVRPKNFRVLLSVKQYDDNPRPTTKRRWQG